MWGPLILVAFLGFAKAEIRSYDTFTATEISQEKWDELLANNKTLYCAIQVEDCDPEEGRRLDGSCNNLEYPTKGAAHTVVKRLLEPAYADGFEPRLSKKGTALPLSRRARTRALAEGKVPSTKFTQLVTNFWLFMTLDFTLSADTLNYVINIPFCCTAQRNNYPLCAANSIPDDDPVHRFSDVRCMNMTKPTSYQNQGCTSNDTAPDRLNTASPPFDLSFLYGTFLNISLGARLNESGLLRYEVDEDGKIWPPSIKVNPKNTCRLNEEPAETRCNETPVQVANTLLGANLFLIWLWRHHNKVASELAEINPSWSDEKLFYTARDINIAISTQIYYYELMPLMMGKNNLINDNVISADSGFRDIYNDTMPPVMTYEFLYALRWVHTIQEGTVKMYDTEGHYLKQIPYGNLTFRTGYLAVDNNMEYITQGAFRQPCAQNDYIVDPDVSEVSLGPLQRSLDLLVNDHAKARYLGLQPYIKYREYCTGKKHSTFEDFADVMDQERIEQLMDIYDDPEDVDLLAGIWLERPIEGGIMPSTAYCLVSQQLVRNVVSDRHWYERPNRPDAFTAEQLMQIKKASIARFMCDVGDAVTKIQPEAFRREAPGNEIVSCENIPKVDLSAWKEY